MIFDYICDHTPAIVTLTEHWLTDLDSSVRAEIFPKGYKILDHTRSDHRGGGTGIIYHESLDVKKIDAGVSVRYSYEFSEWIVKSGSIAFVSQLCTDHPTLSTMLSLQMYSLLNSQIILNHCCFARNDY